jgi:hypothetical protein
MRNLDDETAGPSVEPEPRDAAPPKARSKRRKVLLSVLLAALAAPLLTAVLHLGTDAVANKSAMDAQVKKLNGITAHLSAAPLPTDIAGGEQYAEATAATNAVASAQNDYSANSQRIVNGLFSTSDTNSAGSGNWVTGFASTDGVWVGTTVEFSATETSIPVIWQFETKDQSKVIGAATATYNFVTKKFNGLTVSPASSS